MTTVKRLHHPTVTCYDSLGSYGDRCVGLARRFVTGGSSFVNWANSHWVDSMMTEEERLAYNVRELGVNGAAEFELNYQTKEIARFVDWCQQRRV